MMVEKLNRFSAALYTQMLMLGMTMKEGLRSLKNDERGLSGIVVAVLLILIAVFAVVFLWDGLKNMLQDLWGQITGSEGTGAISAMT